MQGKKMDIFNFRIDPETRDALDLLSRAAERPKGDTIRLLIKNAARPLLENGIQSKVEGEETHNAKP